MGRKDFTIGVVIPTHDEESTIGSLINQLRIQTTRPDEIVVVDGMSSDGTVEKAKEKGATVFQGHSSIGEARHHGTVEAGTDLVVQTDGDVVNVSPRWLEFLTEPLIDGDAVVTTGNIRDPKSSHINPLLHHGGNLGAVVFGRAAAANLSFKRQRYLETGGFPDADACEDHDLILEMRKMGNHVHIDRPEAAVEMQVDLVDWVKRTIREFG